VTHVTRNARIDLLFTMSDITGALRQKPRAPGLSFSRTSFLKVGRAAWWSQTGSNRRPPACKAGALPTELWPRASRSNGRRPPSLKLRRTTFAARRLACQPKRHWPRRLVGLGRFELPTSRLSSARSNQLSYKPGPGVSNQQSVIRKRSSI
jgi:hypothetical protein